MGEAARRKAREIIWRTSLEDDEKIVFDVAQRLSPFVPPFGPCYQASFFLRLYLEKIYGIVGLAIVGFVNDGTDDVFASHAWYEFRGKMTDLAISRPLNPHLQRPGPVTIHGLEIRPGWTWTYHREEPPEGRAALEALLARPEMAPRVQEELARRQRMAMIATDLDMIRDYLDRADNGLTYDVMAARLAGC
jgi:hypothetical protein